VAEREPEPATDQRGQPFRPDCPEPRMCRLGNLCLGSCKLMPAEPSSVNKAELGFEGGLGVPDGRGAAVASKAVIHALSDG
jgi:hypothetical protein